MYLTQAKYEEITNEKLSSSEFVRLEFKSRKAVDLATFNRFKSVETYPEELTMLMAELVTKYNTSLDTGRTVQSVSYSQGSRSQSETYKLEDSESVVSDLIMQYLTGVYINDVAVLYRGGVLW